MHVVTMLHLVSYYTSGTHDIGHYSHDHGNGLFLILVLCMHLHDMCVHYNVVDDIIMIYMGHK